MVFRVRVEIKGFYVVGRNPTLPCSNRSNRTVPRVSLATTMVGKEYFFFKFLDIKIRVSLHHLIRFALQFSNIRPLHTACVQIAYCLNSLERSKLTIYFTYNNVFATRSFVSFHGPLNSLPLLSRHRSEMWWFLLLPLHEI